VVEDASERSGDNYARHPQNENIHYRVAPTLPPDDIDEQWRQVRVEIAFYL